MRETITEKLTMTVYWVPQGRGYQYASTNGGYGYIAVSECAPNPYDESDYEGGNCDAEDACMGTFDGVWEGEDEGFGDCTFRCEIGTCHA